MRAPKPTSRADAAVRDASVPGAKVNRAVMSVADDTGKFGEPIALHGLAYSRVKVAPAVAVGKDGSIHVAGWSEAEGHNGIWYEMSSDGAKFRTPVAVANPEQVAGAGVQVAVDGDGTAFIAIRDGNAAGTEINVRSACSKRARWQ